MGAGASASSPGDPPSAAAAEKWIRSQCEFPAWRLVGKKPAVSCTDDSGSFHWNKNTDEMFQMRTCLPIFDFRWRWEEAVGGAADGSRSLVVWRFRSMPLGEEGSWVRIERGVIVEDGVGTREDFLAAQDG
jgi:hypothetical protein